MRSPFSVSRCLAFIVVCTLLFDATERSFTLDGRKGQRVVVRHNTFKNALIGNHGTESSGRLRGARSFEIYSNVIRYTGSTWPDAISFRSGTGVVFNMEQHSERSCWKTGQCFPPT